MFIPIEVDARSKNYWEVYSPKLKRNISLTSDLQYLYWVLIETNPKITSFCERPMQIRQCIDGVLVDAIFDMWIESDFESSFVAIKSVNQLNIKHVEGRKIMAQRRWCEENGFKFTLVMEHDIQRNQTQLMNMKSILHHIKHITENDQDIAVTVK